MAEWSTILAAALVLASLAWMLALVLWRVARDRADRRRAADRAEALQILVNMVVEPTPQLEAELAPYLGRTRLMAELVLDLELLVGGDDRARVFMRLRELGLDRAFAKQFRRSKLARTYLEALAAVGGGVAAEALQDAALTARDPAIRLAALSYVLGMGAEVSVRSLLDWAVRGELEISRPFYELLRQVTAASPEEAMAAFADRTLPVRLRAMLIDALGVSGEYEALDTLVAATNEEAEIRTAAVRALGRLIHPSVEPVIRKALQDPVWTVRSAAAEAAGRARLIGLVPLLADLLDDPEWWVRLRAGQALAALGAPGKDALEATVREGPALAQRTAEAALAEHLAA